MLPTRIEYDSADPYDTYTMYNPADVHWDVLNNILSLYNLHNYRVFGLNGLFDIWCAKASRETFRSIKDDAIFEKLLLRSRVFPDVYENKKSESIQNATRNMNPATDVHHAHWERFTWRISTTQDFFTIARAGDRVFFIPFYTPFVPNKAIYNIQLRLNPLGWSAKYIRIVMWYILTNNYDTNFSNNQSIFLMESIPPTFIRKIWVLLNLTWI